MDDNQPIQGPMFYQVQPPQAATVGPLSKALNLSHETEKLVSFIFILSYNHLFFI